jgi:hypothetical protein
VCLNSDPFLTCVVTLHCSGDRFLVPQDFSPRAFSVGWFCSYLLPYQIIAGRHRWISEPGLWGSSQHTRSLQTSPLLLFRTDVCRKSQNVFSIWNKSPFLFCPSYSLCQEHCTELWTIFQEAKSPGAPGRLPSPTRPHALVGLSKGGSSHLTFPKLKKTDTFYPKT